jgi:hypothetical protein
MASGHVNRANRPNTWLLRPMLQMKILLANPEPSTHGPSRHIAAPRNLGRYGGDIADIDRRLFVADGDAFETDIVTQNSTATGRD